MLVAYSMGVCATQVLCRMIESVHHIQVAFGSAILGLVNGDGDRVWVLDPDQRSELKRISDEIMGK